MQFCLLVSLAPRFSAVIPTSRQKRETVETVSLVISPDVTGLKPGANEKLKIKFKLHHFPNVTLTFVRESS